MHKIWRYALVGLILCTTLMTAEVTAQEEPPRRLVQLGFHVAQGEAQTLATARQAGATFVVQLFNWADIEPTPNYFYWEKPDATLRAAAFYGLRVVARLDRPPAWAVDEDGVAPWSLDAYAHFVSKVVERYGDRLDGVIIWNEPNLRLEWQDRQPDPVAYVALLRAGYQAAKGVAPTLPVLAAGLAFTSGGDGNENDLAFLQGFYEAGGRPYFDILAAHPYGFDQSPTAPPTSEQLNFRRLELHRAIMVAHGDRDKPIWITESGWRTRAPQPADAWQVVTPTEQAAYMQAALTQVATEYEWIERLAFWQLDHRGDPYGFDLWAADKAPSLAYAKLFANCQIYRADCKSRQGQPNVEPQPETIEILAADVTIRLGDRSTLHPHWVHLYGGAQVSQQWQGEFFLPPAAARRPTQLLLETMQVDQPTNMLFINDQQIGHLMPRAQPDPTSSWVTQELSIPVGLLRPGVNQIVLRVGARNPAWQYDYWRWENLQFRHLRLVEAAAQPAQTGLDWAPLISPGGWVEAIRLRPDQAAGFWLLGNRRGQLWRGSLETHSLTPQATNRPDLRFHDLLETPNGTLAATERGLFWRENDEAPWLATGTATTPAYALSSAHGYLYAGFAPGGVRRAKLAQGPWQTLGLADQSVLDFALDGAATLYAATTDGVYQLVDPAAKQPTWQPLPALPANAESTFVTRLYAGKAGVVVARVRDRLWGWQATTASWESFGPVPLDGEQPLSLVTDCCGAEMVVGGLGLGLQQQQTDGSWQPVGAQDQLMGLDLMGMWTPGTNEAAAVVASTNALLSPTNSADAWHIFNGLPATISDLVVDPADANRWLAGTPVGIYRSTNAGQSWQAITPPWPIYDLAWDGQGQLYGALNRGLVVTRNAAAPQATWRTSQGYNRVHLFTVAPHPTTTGLIWAGTWGNDIGVSSDSGATLQGLGNGLETLSILSILWHATPGQITVGTIAGLQRSDDGGLRWFALGGPLADQTVYALDQGQDGTLWAGATDGLWRSRDYGATWERLETLGTKTVIRLGTLTAADGQVWLWVGTEGAGLWLSTADGEEWQPAGFNGDTVYALISHQGRLIAGTANGLFATPWPAMRHTTR